MELHSLLSQMDNTNLEQYMNECKGKLLDFLEDLGLSNAQALYLLDYVWAYVLRNNGFLFIEYSDNQLSPGQASTEQYNLKTCLSDPGLHHN